MDILQYFQSLGYQGTEGKDYRANGRKLTLKNLLLHLRVDNGLDKSGLERMEKKTISMACSGDKNALELIRGEISSLKYEAPHRQAGFNQGSIRAYEDMDSEDMAKIKRLIFINTEKRCLIEFSNKYILAEMCGLSLEDINDGSFPRGRVEFNPFNPEFVREERDESIGTDISIINAYNPPEWRTLKERKGSIPDLIQKLITHLFPRPEEIEQVLDWMHYAVVKRNQTVLSLVGPRGSGKTLFYQVLASVVGHDLSEMVPPSALNSQFNSQLHNNRLVFFDEVDLQDKTAMDAVKRNLNDIIPIEKKGVDAFTAINYSSQIMATNDMAKFEVKHTDRRYSIPEVNSKDLKYSMSEEEIATLVAAVSRESMDLDMIAEFGYFLLNRKPKHSEFFAIKGDYFFHICDLNMPGWIQSVLDYLLEYGEPGKTILFSDIFRKAGGGTSKGPVPTAHRTFVHHISDYKLRGQWSMGEVVSSFNSLKKRSSPALVVANDFIEELKKDRNNKIRLGYIQNQKDEIVEDDDTPTVMGSRKDEPRDEDLI